MAGDVWQAMWGRRCGAGDVGQATCGRRRVADNAGSDDALWQLASFIVAAMLRSRKANIICGVTIYTRSRRIVNARYNTGQRIPKPLSYPPA